MKRALMLLALAGCASEARRLDRAPDFELAALDGTTVRGTELWSNKPVLLVFMTAW